MCIMATNAQPTGTRIFSLPAQFDDTGALATAIVYVNALETRGARQLMIVPFPNAGGEAALKDVLLTPYEPWKAVTGGIEDLFATDDFAMQSLGARNSASRDSMRPVHRVGKYQVSVAPNAETLLRTIDWRRFDVPEDLDARLAVMRDPNVCPATCGFVVAQAVEDVQNDGFAVVYPGGDVFLPTCHKRSARGYDDSVSYDAKCYVVDAIPLWNGRVRRDSSNAPWSAHVDTLARATTHIAGTVAGDAASRTRGVSMRAGARFASKLKLRGNDVNMNVFVAGTGDFSPAAHAHAPPAPAPLKSVFLPPPEPEPRPYISSAFSTPYAAAPFSSPYGAAPFSAHGRDTPPPMYYTGAVPRFGTSFPSRLDDERYRTLYR
jgi:hypothetical protein